MPNKCIKPVRSAHSTRKMLRISLAAYAWRWALGEKMTKLVMLFSVFALMSGCATTTYTPAASEAADAATVYFIRQHAEPTAWSLGIYMGGNKLASLANNSHVVVKVQPGTQSVELKWPPLAGQKNLTDTLTLKPNETSYYLISAGFSNVQFAGGVPTSNSAMGLAPVTKAEAESIMAQLKH